MSPTSQCYLGEDRTVFQGGVGRAVCPAPPTPQLLGLPARHWWILFSCRLGFYQKLTGLSCLIRAAVLLLMVFCNRLRAEMWIVLGSGSSGQPWLGSESPVGSPWNAAPLSHAGMGLSCAVPVFNTHTPTPEHSEAVPPPRGSSCQPGGATATSMWNPALPCSLSLGLPWDFPRDTSFLCSAAAQLSRDGLCWLKAPPGTVLGCSVALCSSPAASPAAPELCVPIPPCPTAPRLWLLQKELLSWKHRSLWALGTVVGPSVACLKAVFGWRNARG